MSRKRFFIAVGLGLLALCALAGLAEARPGGGHSYSGGSSGGGGDGGGGGALVELLIRLIIYKPQIGIPVAIVVGVGVYIAKRNNDGLSDWDSGESIMSAVPSADLDNVRAHDPEFSMVLFTDFAYALYAAAHRARHTPAELDKLGPYLSPAARNHLHNRLPPGVPVQAVVIGSMRITNSVVPVLAHDSAGHDMPVKVTLSFESNITVGNESAQQNHFTREVWNLSRAASVRSRPPGSTRTFPCPNCGAPFEATDTAACSYCGEIVGGGRFDWGVDSISLLSEEMRPPNLAGHARERGGQLATVYHDDFRQNFAELQAADPSVTHESLFERVRLIFVEVNQAWSQLDLRPARPFVSDGMADYLGYWVDAYQRQGLRNVTENPQITSWDICRVTRDKYFDAIVVRLFAKSLDYTLESRTGKVVGGSKSSPRDYSEYWTLVRASQARGTPPNGKACPNCGADLAIGMGGNCEYCGVHVTAGEFDWVLSKIEQDEAYTG